LPYLRPALVGAAAIVSDVVRKFNATLMLVGSDPDDDHDVRPHAGARAVLQRGQSVPMAASALVALNPPAAGTRTR
jgi:hypothetical protein